MAVLFERLVLLGCSLANVERRPHATQPDRRSIVPAGYRFHTPCPFGRTEPEASCRFCNLHTEQYLVQRAIDEAEADAAYDAMPHAWETVSPQPYPRE